MVEPGLFAAPTVAAMNAMSFGSSKYIPFSNTAAMASAGLPAFRFIMVPWSIRVFTSAKSRCNTVNSFQKSKAMMMPISTRQRRSVFLLPNHGPEFDIHYFSFDFVMKIESLNLPDIAESGNDNKYCTGIRQLIKRTCLNVILFF